LEKKGYIALDGKSNARAISVLANEKGQEVKLTFEEVQSE
jgi:hypothetical protein